MEDELKDEVGLNDKLIQEPKQKIKLEPLKNLIELNADKDTFDLAGMTNRAKVRYNAKLVEDSESFTKFESKDTILIFRKI
jgi:hypothetical protein